MAQLNPKKPPAVAGALCGGGGVGEGEVMGFMPRQFPECLLPGRPGVGAGGDGQVLLIPVVEEISQEQITDV